MKAIKKNILIIMASVLMLSIVTGTTTAYLTDTETARNVFTFGDVTVSVTETEFPQITPNDPDKDGNGIPDGSRDDLEKYQTVDKNPQVKNTGDNPAIVFIEVISPTEYVSVYNAAEGTWSSNALQEIFWYVQDRDGLNPEYITANDWNDDTDITSGYWLELDIDNHEVTAQDGYATNTEGTGYRYVFGYYKALSTGETTDALFDMIVNKRYRTPKTTIDGVQYQLESDEVESVFINVYAIQADNLFSKDEDGTLSEMETGSVFTQDYLEDVYDIILSQAE